MARNTTRARRRPQGALTLEQRAAVMSVEATDADGRRRVLLTRASWHPFETARILDQDDLVRTLHALLAPTARHFGPEAVWEAVEALAPLIGTTADRVLVAYALIVMRLESATRWDRDIDLAAEELVLWRVSRRQRAWTCCDAWSTILQCWARAAPNTLSSGDDATGEPSPTIVH